MLKKSWLKSMMVVSKLKIKELVETVFSDGDLLIVSIKGHGKTVTLFNIARAFRNVPDTRVIIFEDFPKWMNEFDTIPYFVVHDSDVKDSGKTIIDLSDIWLRHEKSFTILKGREIKHILKTYNDVLFLSEIEDTDRQAFLMYSIFRYFYRKQYQRAKKNIKKKERIIFIIEESQNLCDSAVISRNLFSRFRKKFAVARNLNIHFILTTQRFQDISTKIRGRALLMVGRVNVDDYELKVRRLTRHSKYRAKLTDKTQMTKGKFLFIPSDKLIQFPIFKQRGKPYEIEIKIRLGEKTVMPQTQTTQPKQPKPKEKENLLLRIWKAITLQTYFENVNGYQINNTDTQYDEEDEEEESDGILFIDDEDP